MVAENGAAGLYLTKEQRPSEPAEAAAVSGSESGRCVPASLCCPLSISNPRVGGAWSGHLLFWPHPTWHTCSRALQKAYTHAHAHTHTHTVMQIKPRNFTRTHTTFSVADKGSAWICSSCVTWEPAGVTCSCAIQSPGVCRLCEMTCATYHWHQTFPYLTPLSSHSFMAARGDDPLALPRVFCSYLIASSFPKGNTSLRYAKPLFHGLWETQERRQTPHHLPI